MELARCSWPGNDPLMISYHDEEWGSQVHDDNKWFEYILLDTFQAGLSWKTILHRREAFRKAFDNFNFQKISAYTEADYERLINDASIIRNRAKVRGTIKNANAFIAIIEEFGSFDKYIWQFTDNKIIVNHWKQMSDIPASTEISDKVSKDLKKRGFAFVGSTICYAFMQGGGIVNDHLESCFRFEVCSGK